MNYKKGMSGVVTIIIILLIIVVGVIAITNKSEINENDTNVDVEADISDNTEVVNDEINSYEDCVEAGFMIRKSNPPQCMTDDGRNFIYGKKVVEITYAKIGFNPKTISVLVGTTVTWKNIEGQSMWVASAFHPSHEELPEFDQLYKSEAGNEYSFTFTKVGTWKYHNHVRPGDVGTVIVK